MLFHSVVVFVHCDVIGNSLTADNEHIGGLLSLSFRSASTGDCEPRVSERVAAREEG